MSYTFESRLTRTSRWAVAIFFGVVLHASAASLVLMQPEPHEEETADSGPLLFDLAPLAVAPPKDTKAPIIGPRSDATPEMMETQEKAKPTAAEETPKVEKTEHEPEDPDLKLPENKPEEKVEEKEEKEEPEKEVEEAEQEPTPAAKAAPEMAPPPIKAPRAEKAAAPTPGLSEADKKTIATWQKKVAHHLHRHKRYPSAARRKRIEGKVIVSFSIDREGRVVAYAVVNGSGAKILDDAALDILERASPLPTPPSQLVGNAFEFTLPIHYQVK